MNRNTRYCVVGRKAGCLRHIAMARVDHQRRTDLTGLDRLLHGSIAAVITAHEADLHQPSAACNLCADDLLAFLCGLCQRLFTEYEFARLDAFKHIARMGRVCGCDEHSLYFGACDQLFAGRAAGDAVLFCNRLCRRLVIIRNGNYARFGNRVHQACDMLSADRTAADDTDFDFLAHVRVLLPVSWETK